MDRRSHRPLWVIALMLLLAGEVTWLLSTLQVISIPFFSRSKQKGSVEAGYVIRSRQDLKRRARNSLVWETSKDADTLYYYDSILTLSQSEANLYLKDQTELHLAENTLVTLEPSDGKSNSEIRLRFSKGDVRARNPAMATLLKDDDWSVMLEVGSEISVRKQNGQVEFDVHQGRAILNNKTGIQILGVEDILRMQDGKAIEKLTKNKNLKWKETPDRNYTLTPVGAVPVKWQGRAQKIQIQKVGQAIETVPIGDGEQEKILPLPPGSYTLRLEDESGVSESTRIEVWSAPRIVLRKPLPRDRLKTLVDNDFVWSLLPEVKEYRLRLFRAGAPENVFSSKVNFFDLRYNDEADLTWAVEGVDGEGHIIPSPYDSPVFFRHDPLQAPVLKGPTLRKPAHEKDEGAFWFRLLMEQAHAQEPSDLEAVFQWEPVPGADQYVIEICSTPDFRQTEVMKTVRTPEFVWRKFVMGKYYWRVAAGHSAGRMGVFTAPVELNFQDLKPGQTGEINGVVIQKVEVKKIVVSKPKQVKPVAPPKLVEAVVPPPEPAEALPAPVLIPVLNPVRVLLPRFGFAWAPSYRATDLVGSESTHLRLAGKAPMTFHVDMEKPINENEFWAFDFWRADQTWKPEPAAEFPFQSDLKIPETWIRVEKGSRFRAYRQGLSIHQSFTPQRLENEALSNKEQWLFGYRGSFLWEKPLTEYVSEKTSSALFGFSVSTSGSVHELAADLLMKRYLPFRFDDRSYFIGFETNVVLQAGASRGTQVSGFILLGMDWFRKPFQRESESEGNQK